MKPIPSKTIMHAIARRVVWFKPPQVTLEQPLMLLAYAMKHSTDRDMATLIAIYGMDGIRAALYAAPPGIIDPRSWTYWNARAGRVPPPPMPVRSFDAPTLESKHT